MILAALFLLFRIKRQIPGVHALHISSLHVHSEHELEIALDGEIVGTSQPTSRSQAKPCASSPRSTSTTSMTTDNSVPAPVTGAAPMRARTPRRDYSPPRPSF